MSPFLKRLSEYSLDTSVRRHTYRRLYIVNRQINLESMKCNIMLAYLAAQEERLRRDNGTIIRVCILCRLLDGYTRKGCAVRFLFEAKLSETEAKILLLRSKTERLVSLVSLVSLWSETVNFTKETKRKWSEKSEAKKLKQNKTKDGKSKKQS